MSSTFAMEVANPDVLLGLNRADQRTQMARIRALKGKKCLFITAPTIPGMSNHMRTCVQWSVAQGVEITAVFHSAEDKLYPIFQDHNLMVDSLFADLMGTTPAQNIVDAVGDRKFDGVFTPYEPALVLAAEVAELLNIHVNPSNAYRIARSKNLARECTREAGLATPRTGMVRTREELEGVVRHVGFPLIMKPSSGAFSLSVLRADTLEKAISNFDSIQADILALDWLRWSPGCEASAVLVEQCLLGDEFDVDMLMYDGKMVYGAPVDNWPCQEPYYLETGSQMPSLYPDDKQEEICQYAADCVRAMGFKTGCFHVELMYTSEGPVLIEVNARQGGGGNQMFNIELAHVDIWANFFMSMMNIPINPPRVKPTAAMADYGICCAKTGTLVDDGHMDHIRAHPDLYWYTVDAAVGSKVKGIDTGFPQWLNNFFIKADDKFKAKAIVESLVHGIDKKMNIRADEPVPAAVKIGSPSKPER